MPVTYRSAKSVILKGHKLGAIDWSGDMGKSAIEKAIKKQECTKLQTPEELLGTIIKCCDQIKVAYEGLDEEHKVLAEGHIKDRL